MLATIGFFSEREFAFFDWLQGSTKTYEGKVCFLGTDSQDSDDGFWPSIRYDEESQ